MRYEKYKDSGIEWIGEIPEHWKVVKLKHYANLYGRIGWQGLTSDEYQEEGPYLITGIDFEDGGINWERCHHITEERWREADKVQINNGDLLITKDGTVGKIAIVDGLNGKASLNSGVMLIDLKQVNKKFMFYLLASEVFWKWFNYVNLGQTTIKHLYQNVFKEFSFPQPNKNEQDEIASYLDEKTAKIDSIIKSLEKQKDKLEEYKRALISETVTKGLDKNVSMKDSGVDWLGEIPEHWEVFPLFYLLEENKDKNNGMKNSNLLSLSYGNIIRKDIDTPFGLLPSSFEGYQIVNNGDIILRLTDLQNDKRSLRTGFVKEKGIITSAYVGLKQSPIKSNSEYIHYVLHAYDLKKLFYSMGGGLRQSLNFSAIKRIPLLFPPLKEQSKIVEELNRKQLKINSIRKQIELQIEKLKEYRKIIIHDAVTGKIKVGGSED